MRDYHTPRFRTSQIAQAAGMPASTFRSYFKRGHFHVVGFDTKKADADGLPNLFSLRDALTFAVAGSLISAGADPSKAFTAAVQWAHAGNLKRLPAELFATGYTVMVFDNPTGDSRVINVGGKINPLEFFADQHGPARIVVLLNLIERNVFGALNE
jgi:hypothetical protein